MNKMNNIDSMIKSKLPEKTKDKPYMVVKVFTGAFNICIARVETGVVSNKKLDYVMKQVFEEQKTYAPEELRYTHVYSIFEANQRFF